MIKVEDFSFIFSSPKHHQNPWSLVTVGVRTDVDHGGMGEVPDVDVVVLDMQNQQGKITKAILGDIDTVDNFIQLLQVAKATLQLKQSARELQKMDYRARKEIKQY